MENAVSYQIHGRCAVVTLNNPRKLNALTSSQFYDVATFLRDIDKIEDVIFTILTGTGRFFSAGADITETETRAEKDLRRHYLQTTIARNLYLTHTIATHSKILVAALNGPAVGGSAALVAFADLVYAVPEAYIAFPFTSLGLFAELGTSRTIVQRLGVSLANEAMLMGRKIDAEELKRCGFVNKIIPAGVDSVPFSTHVITELKERFGDVVNTSSLLGIKALMRRPERDIIATQNVAEAIEGLDQLTTGKVDEQMRMLREGEKRHKL